MTLVPRLHVKVQCLVCHAKATGTSAPFPGSPIELPFGWSNESDYPHGFAPVCSRDCKGSWKKALAEDSLQ